MRIKWNNRGFYDIRRQPALVAQEEKLARGIAARANAELGEPGFQVGSRQGARRPQGRWRTSVAAVTMHARRADRKRNILLKSLKG